MSKMIQSNSHQLLGSITAGSIFISLLCFLMNPMWETNDDVGFSMVAHGYAGSIGSPNLIYSNVLWGYLVQAIPSINGVFGYSIATLSVLLIVSATLTYGLLKLRLDYINTLAIIALILVRPVLFPQFTINSGLLMVSAIMCWSLYASQNNKLALITGCILAFLSYLVRSQEFLLVLIVGLPLLPWRTLLQQRFFQFVILILISAIVASTVIDHQAYQGHEWNVFNELKPVISPIVDYGAGEKLKLRQDILDRYGFSPNDIDLLENWFFVDPNIANPEKLKKMLDELGPLYSEAGSLANAWEGVKTLWHPSLITTILAALVLAITRPSCRILSVWILCIVAIFTIGLLGRPGVLRIYVPLASLLLIAPFWQGKVTSSGNHFAIGVLITSALFNTQNVISEAKKNQMRSEQIRKILIKLPNYPVVIWGAGFPYEATYPVLRVSPSMMSFKIYGLDGLTHAPYSFSYVEQQQGRGFTDLLITLKGLPMFIDESWKKQAFEFLTIYCKEHHHGKLKELSSQQYGEYGISQISCNPEHM